eukprot:SAG31_NODE_600_length_13647_cov_3.894376_7_plen_75_part_00
MTACVPHCMVEVETSGLTYVECASSGWVAALSSWYGRNADVRNRGLSGSSAREGLIATARLLEHRPQVITITPL